MKMRLAMATLLALAAVPALAGERLECFLTGSGYKNESYPSGRKATWYIDGDVMRRHRPGEMKDLAVPMATMRIIRRDDKVLIAEWAHTLPEGSTYRLAMDLPTGNVLESTMARGRYSGADGHCKLLAD